jgi:hypothetical protein
MQRAGYSNAVIAVSAGNADKRGQRGLGMKGEASVA